jgi:hypothetical protein
MSATPQLGCQRRRNVSAPKPASANAAPNSPHGVSAGAGVPERTGTPSIDSQSAKAPTPQVPVGERPKSPQRAQILPQSLKLLAVVKHETGVPVGQSSQRQHDPPARPGAITSSRRTELVASARTPSTISSPRSRSAMLPFASPSARHRNPCAVGRAGICTVKCHKGR